MHNEAALFFHQYSQAEPATSPQPGPSRVSGDITVSSSPVPGSSQPSTSRDSIVGDSQPPSPYPLQSFVPQQPGPARKRRRTDTSRAVLEQAIGHLEVAEANRQQRHKERMAIEERKVSAEERRTAAIERVAAALEWRVSAPRSPSPPTNA